MPNSGEITRLLERLAEPEVCERESILQQLVPLVYSELKSLARSNRYRWQGIESLGTTSLVHEAYAKLAAHDRGRYQTRQQFYALASRAMRTILIDQARYNERLKRGGKAKTVSLPEAALVSNERSRELVALDEALGVLESQEPELARIVECRCFGGLTVEETAEALSLSTATIKRRWALARAWLFRELTVREPG